MFSLTSWRPRILLLLAGAASFLVGRAVRLADVTTLPPAFADEVRAVVEPRPLEVDGKQVGALLVNGQEVLRLTQRAGEYTAVGRAFLVADRLQKLIDAGAKAQDVRAARDGGEWSLLVMGNRLVAADAEAGAANLSPQRLAERWAGNLRKALGGEGAPAAAEWQPTEPYDDKWVPIISVLEGVKLGVARVNGPTSQVRKVKAVAQLETHFRDLVEIDVYIPIDASIPKSKLARVKGVAVTGLGDYRL